MCDKEQLCCWYEVGWQQRPTLFRDAHLVHPLLGKRQCDATVVYAQEADARVANDGRSTRTHIGHCSGIIGIDGHKGYLLPVWQGTRTCAEQLDAGRHTNVY